MRSWLRDPLLWLAALSILPAFANGRAFAQTTPPRGCGTLDDPFEKGQCLRLSFTDEVSQGQTFERALGGNLKFRLDPAGRGKSSGWTIEVVGKSQKPDEPEYSWVVTPPYHFYNPRYLISGQYDMKADEAVRESPRDFNFVLDDGQYARASDLFSVAEESHPADAQKTDARWEKEGEDAAEAQSHFPVAKGRLTILDSKVAAVPDSPFGRIESIKFRVELRVPCDFSRVGISPDLAVDASSCSGHPE
jgi:hypothetical protein